jgi:uncharacterized repeat protein (TIGR01451 family)
LVLTNTAGVTATVSDPITVNNASLVTVTVAQQANLSVVKTVDPPVLIPGAVLTYTITISNIGPSDTSWVTVTDLISNTGSIGAPIADPGWSCVQVGNAFTCTFTDTFASGASAAVVVTATAPVVTGTITNTVWITSVVPDLQPADNTSVVTVTVSALPLANAGPDRTAYVDELVTLDGTGSYDPDGDLPLAYGWTQTSGASVTLSDATAQPTFTAPGTPTVLTFALVVTDSVGLSSGIADTVVITVVDRPIEGLEAFNDSPTLLGDVTGLWATVVTGTNVTYAWSLGDGSTDVGQAISRTYTTLGWYTAIVTATNSEGSVAATTQVSITEPIAGPIYLPLVMRNYVAAPDLVVESIVATAYSIQVVIRNQGGAPIESAFANEFWVDVYVDPSTPPTSVNQTWQHVGSHGVVWGVTQDALPLNPGDTLTLTVTPTGGTYYHPALSSISWPLAAGTTIYCQADSAHTETWYGGILENHEIVGGTYNNISGPVVSTSP